MPQFDNLVFFSQIFWVVIIFITFYVIFIKNFLINLTRGLKLRQKRLNAGEKISLSNYLKDSLKIQLYFINLQYDLRSLLMESKNLYKRKYQKLSKKNDLF